MCAAQLKFADPARNSTALSTSQTTRGGSLNRRCGRDLGPFTSFSTQSACSATIWMGASILIVAAQTRLSADGLLAPYVRRVQQTLP